MGNGRAFASDRFQTKTAGGKNIALYFFFLAFTPIAGKLT
jgi:hypothetical protein